MENPKISSVSGDILGFYMVFHILDGKMFHFHDVFWPTAKWQNWMGKPQVGLADDHESSAVDRSLVEGFNGGKFCRVFCGDFPQKNPGKMLVNMVDIWLIYG